MLFNEPKLLKSFRSCGYANKARGFSALQRAEIAEICVCDGGSDNRIVCFSALQRAEIAEISVRRGCRFPRRRFSALQRAEIAEMICVEPLPHGVQRFQCSSTSRNC